MLGSSIPEAKRWEPSWKPRQSQQSGGRLKKKKKTTNQPKASVLFNKETGGEKRKKEKEQEKDKNRWTTIWSMHEQDGRDICDFIITDLSWLWGFWPIHSPLKNPHASGVHLNFAHKLLLFQYPVKRFKISPCNLFAQNQRSYR